jgi:uncharacterized membrane protein
MNYDLKNALNEATITSGQKTALYFIWFSTEKIFWATFFLGFFLSGPYQPYLWGMLAWIFALSATTTAAILRKASETDTLKPEDRSVWQVVKDTIIGNISWVVLVFIFTIIANGTSLLDLKDKESFVGQMVNIIVEKSTVDSDVPIQKSDSVMP